MAEEKKDFAKKTPQTSFDIADFYNYITEGGARLKISLWSDRILLHFSLWNNESKEKKEEKVWLNYDLLLIIENTLKELVYHRYEAWKAKKPYPEFSIPIKNTYLDKEQVPHVTGTLFIKTVPVKEPTGEVNRVQLLWTSPKGDFHITLGNKLIPLIVSESPDLIARVDPIDTSFYRLALTLNKISSSMVQYAIGVKLAELIVGGGRSGGGDDAGGGYSGGNRGGGGRDWNNNRGGQQGGGQRQQQGRFQTQTQVEDSDLQF